MPTTYRYDVSYSSKSANLFVEDNTDVPVHNFTDVTITDTVEVLDGSVDLNGNYFLFPDYENFYFHTLRDFIAQYELIKTYVPDLKPLVLCACGKNDEVHKPKSCLGSNPKTSPEFFILDNYKEDLVVIDCVGLNRINISSLYLIYVSGPDQLTQLVEDYSYDRVILNTNNAYWLEDVFAKTLRLSFGDYLSITDPGVKIYVSRLKESKNTWEISDAWDVYQSSGSLPDDPVLSLTIKNIAKATPQSVEELEMKKSRAYSVSDELMLEEYFASKGYKVISPGDYTVQEQISLFSSSSVVAGAGGSGMTNMLFCNPDARIIMISAGNRFNFGGHTPLARALGKRCSFFPERVTVDHDNPDYVKFSAKEIIDMIESSGVKL